MNELEKIRTWEYLKEQIKAVYDIPTRNLYYKALLVRAMNEWGFNPDRPTESMPTEQTPELNDWEKGFVEDINDSIMFGFDTRVKKREQEYRWHIAEMKLFIEEGGTLKDIPDSIRTPGVKKLYFDTLFRIGDELSECADYFINCNEN